MPEEPNAVSVEKRDPESIELPESLGSSLKSAFVSIDSSEIGLQIYNPDNEKNSQILSGEIFVSNQNRGHDEDFESVSTLISEVSLSNEKIDAEFNILPFVPASKKEEQKTVSRFILPDLIEEEPEGKKHFAIFNRFLSLSRTMSSTQTVSEKEDRISSSDISLTEEKRFPIPDQKNLTCQSSPNSILGQMVNSDQSAENRSSESRSDQEQPPKESRFYRLLMRLTGRQKRHLADFLESMEDKTT